jgi:peptidoglycan/LPS O-acetylase OafA/YrhL
MLYSLAMEKLPDSPDLSERIYFPGFNAVRLFAVLMVMVHHTEELKSDVGLPNAWSRPWIFGLGSEGVNMFFVLSGFLITYLLLSEQRRFGDISVPQFYLRRVLRIHPLYFLLIFVAFFIGPHLPVGTSGPVNLMIQRFNESLAPHFRPELAMFLFMIPNLAMIRYPPVLFALQSWSIGVEEQFYLLWPWFVRAFRGKLMRSLTVLILFKCILDVCLVKIVPKIAGDGLSPLIYFLVGFRLDSLALGALGAAAFFLSPIEILSWFSNKWVMNAWVLILGVCSLFVPMMPFHHFLWPVVCVLLILNLATTSPTSRILENPVCNYLGKISYGLYMYHACAITLALKVLEWARPSSFISGSVGGLWVTNGILYSCMTFFTVLFATLSYFLIEKKFLDLKQKTRSISNPG